MPIFEFKCALGHVTERFVRSTSDADPIERTICEKCGEVADKILSVPSPPKLVGAGFYKPSSPD